MALSPRAQWSSRWFSQDKNSWRREWIRQNPVLWPTEFSVLWSCSSKHVLVKVTITLFCFLKSYRDIEKVIVSSESMKIETSQNPRKCSIHERETQWFLSGFPVLSVLLTASPKSSQWDLGCLTCIHLRMASAKGLLLPQSSIALCVLSVQSAKITCDFCFS